MLEQQPLDVVVERERACRLIARLSRDDSAGAELARERRAHRFSAEFEQQLASRQPSSILEDRADRRASRAVQDLEEALHAKRRATLEAEYEAEVVVRQCPDAANAASSTAAAAHRPLDVLKEILDDELSVKSILDFRSWGMGNHTAEVVATAAACAVANTDETVRLSIHSLDPDRPWPEVMQMLSKPGLFIRCLRKFPAAVDAGQVAEANMVGARHYLDLVDSEMSNGAARGLRRWIAHAIAYWEERLSQGPQLDFAEAVRSPEAGRQVKCEVSKSRVDHPRMGVKPNPATTTPSPLRKEISRTKPAASPPRTTRPAASPSRPSTSPRALRPVASPSRRAPDLRPAQSPQNRSRPSASPRPSTLRQLRPSPKSSSALVRPSPQGETSGAEGIQEWRRMLDETRREVREIKSKESQMRFNMQREERLDRVQVTKAEEEDLRDWRWRETDEMKQYVSEKQQDVRRRDLEEQKDFQSFKREKRQEKVLEERQRVAEDYREDTEQAVWKEELARGLQEQERLVQSQRGETQRELKEIRRAEKEETSRQRHEERHYEQAVEMEHLRNELAREREKLLESYRLTQQATSRQGAVGHGPRGRRGGP